MKSKQVGRVHSDKRCVTWVHVCNRVSKGSVLDPWPLGVGGVTHVYIDSCKKFLVPVSCWLEFMQAQTRIEKNWSSIL